MLKQGVNERAEGFGVLIFHFDDIRLFVELFFGEFLDVFVEFAPEADTAVVTVWFGPSAVGKATWQGCATELAFVGGGTGAGAWGRKNDVADLAAFKGAFAFGC